MAGAYTGVNRVRNTDFRRSFEGGMSTDYIVQPAGTARSLCNYDIDGQGCLRPRAPINHIELSDKVTSERGTLDNTRAPLIGISDTVCDRVLKYDAYTSGQVTTISVTFPYASEATSISIFKNCHLERAYRHTFTTPGAVLRQEPTNSEIQLVPVLQCSLALDFGEGTEYRDCEILCTVSKKFKNHPCNSEALGIRRDKSEQYTVPTRPTGMGAYIIPNTVDVTHVANVVKYVREQTVGTWVNSAGSTDQESYGNTLYNDTEFLDEYYTREIIIRVEGDPVKTYTVACVSGGILPIIKTEHGYRCECVKELGGTLYLDMQCSSSVEHVYRSLVVPYRAVYNETYNDVEWQPDYIDMSGTAFIHGVDYFNYAPGEVSVVYIGHEGPNDTPGPIETYYDYSERFESFNYIQSVIPDVGGAVQTYTDISPQRAVSVGYNLMATTPFDFPNKVGSSNQLRLSGIVPGTPEGLVKTHFKKGEGCILHAVYDAPATGMSQVCAHWELYDGGADSSARILQTVRQSPRYLLGAYAGVQSLPDISLDVQSLKYDNNTYVLKLYDAAEVDDLQYTSIADDLDKLTPIATMSVTIPCVTQSNFIDAELPEYRASDALALHIWRERVVYYRIPKAENIILLSDSSDPMYVPYPANCVSFNGKVYSVCVCKDNLIVFTSAGIYQVSTVDGVTFTSNCVVGHTALTEQDGWNILPYQNMVYYTQQGIPRALVPASYTSTKAGELIPAEIGRGVKELFKDPTGYVKSFFSNIKSTFRAFKPLGYYTPYNLGYTSDTLDGWYPAAGLRASEDNRIFTLRKEQVLPATEGIQHTYTIRLEGGECILSALYNFTTRVWTTHIYITSVTTDPNTQRFLDVALFWSYTDSSLILCSPLSPFDGDTGYTRLVYRRHADTEEKQDLATYWAPGVARHWVARQYIFYGADLGTVDPPDCTHKCRWRRVTLHAKVHPETAGTHGVDIDGHTIYFRFQADSELRYHIHNTRDWITDLIEWLYTEVDLQDFITDYEYNSSTFPNGLDWQPVHVPVCQKGKHVNCLFVTQVPIELLSVDFVYRIQTAR